MKLVKGGPFDAKCSIEVGRITFLVRHAPNRLRIGPWFVERAEFNEKVRHEGTVVKREILLRSGRYKDARACALSRASDELAVQRIEARDASESP